MPMHQLVPPSVERLDDGVRPPARLPATFSRRHDTLPTSVVNTTLAKPHWHVHHTPTSASWLNQVERFFALLTDRQIRRSAHRSLASLHDAITAFIDRHNADPKPFRWTKSADDILASIERFCHRVTPNHTDHRTSEPGPRSYDGTGPCWRRACRTTRCLAPSTPTPRSSSSICRPSGTGTNTNPVKS